MLFLLTFMHTHTHREREQLSFVYFLCDRKSLVSFFPPGLQVFLSPGTARRSLRWPKLSHLFFHSTVSVLLFSTYHMSRGREARDKTLFAALVQCVSVLITSTHKHTLLMSNLYDLQLFSPMLHLF